MRTRLWTFWERLRGTFWFIPAIMLLAAFAISTIMLTLDHAIQLSEIGALAWIYGGGPNGVRSLLSTIAGSMITVAGVTFSITIAALSQAASQLGPRLLSSFMRDRGNQIVLGTFVATFLYSLLILRAIRSTEAEAFVPHLSVALAIVLSVASLGVLIYFFHHVSNLMQAQNVIASVGHDLETSIMRLFPEKSSYKAYEYELRQSDDIPKDFQDEARYLEAPHSGYLQAIDYETIQQVAEKSNLTIQLLYHPGDFISKASSLMAVYPADHCAEEDRENLIETMVLGANRLHLQDVQFSIHQLVEIALRALSPGINDPFTAIACLDQFGTTLSQLAQRTIPSGYYYDSDGNLRVISDTVTFSNIVNEAFDQIRRHSQTDVAVTGRLLQVIAIIIAHAHTNEQKQALIRQAQMIKRGSDAHISEENDRAYIDEHYRLIADILNDEKSNPEQDKTQPSK